MYCVIDNIDSFAKQLKMDFWERFLSEVDNAVFILALYK